MEVTDNIKTNYNWQGKTILIAEDLEFNYKLFVAILKKTGINTIHAINGKEAIIKFKEHPEIELILMDIRMPVMDGLEATRQIRQFNKTIPIIAQTAYSDEFDREKAITAGCNDYLFKPINVELLFQKIDSFIK